MSSSKRKNHEISFVADFDNEMTWVINNAVALRCSNDFVSFASSAFAKSFNFEKKGERKRANIVSFYPNFFEENKKSFHVQ